MSDTKEAKEAKPPASAAEARRTKADREAHAAVTKSIAAAQTRLINLKDATADLEDDIGVLYQSRITLERLMHRGAAFFHPSDIEQVHLTTPQDMTRFWVFIPGFVGRESVDGMAPRPPTFEYRPSFGRSAPPPRIRAENDEWLTEAECQTFWSLVSSDAAMQFALTTLRENDEDYAEIASDHNDWDVEIQVVVLLDMLRAKPLKHLFDDDVAEGD